MLAAQLFSKPAQGEAGAPLPRDQLGKAKVDLRGASLALPLRNSLHITEPDVELCNGMLCLDDSASLLIMAPGVKFADLTIERGSAATSLIQVVSRGAVFQNVQVCITGNSAKEAPGPHPSICSSEDLMAAFHVSCEGAIAQAEGCSVRCARVPPNLFAGFLASGGASFQVTSSKAAKCAYGFSSAGEGSRLQAGSGCLVEHAQHAGFGAYEGGLLTAGQGSKAVSCSDAGFLAAAGSRVMAGQGCSAVLCGTGFISLHSDMEVGPGCEARGCRGTGFGANYRGTLTVGPGCKAVNCKDAGLWGWGLGWA